MLDVHWGSITAAQVFIPYLDSLIQSLDSRFGEQNASYFNMFVLHPKEMKQVSRGQFKERVSSINAVYAIDNLVQEALTWYDVQKHKSQPDNHGMMDLVEETDLLWEQLSLSHLLSQQYIAQLKGH